MPHPRLAGKSSAESVTDAEIRRPHGDLPAHSDLPAHTYLPAHNGRADSDARATSAPDVVGALSRDDQSPCSTT